MGAASRAARSAKHGSRQMPNHDGGEHFAPGLVLEVEPRQSGTVEVEHAQNLAVAQQWHNQLGARGRVASDMTRELLDILHQDRAALLHGRAANSAPGPDTDAGR